jgi:hypothetical protein
MGNYESTSPKPGVRVYRIKGDLTPEDVEKWRENLVVFVKDNRERGACGVLLDIVDLETISTEAVDAVMELLSDPEDIIGDVRTRFALIGVKPFTQRFLRAAMPLAPISHLRARFFYEAAEDEAVAWLTAMVESADDLPSTRPAKTEKTEETGKPVQAEQPSHADKKESPQPESRPPSLKQLLGRDDSKKKGGSAGDAKQKLSQSPAEQKKGEAQKAAP